MIITNIKNLLSCKENILRRGNYIINLLYKFGLIKSPQMKKLYLLIMITGFVTFKGNCQEYIPFPTDTATWHMLDYGQISPEEIFITNYSYTMLGDTVLDNVAYNKIYFHFTGDTINLEYIGGLREDSAKNIFYYPKDPLQTLGFTEFPHDSGELLLYTFDSLYIGKHIPIYEEYNDITVVDIDSVYLGDRYHKRYKVTGTRMIFNTEYWIEGIGSTSELFSVYSYEFEWTLSTLCFTRGSESPVYLSTEYYGEICSFPTGIEDINRERIAFIPNPVSDKMRITSSFRGLYEVTVFNIFGQQVGKFNCSNDNSVIDLGGLRNGIYFLVVKSEEGVFSGKVVKE